MDWLSMARLGSSCNSSNKLHHDSENPSTSSTPFVSAPSSPRSSTAGARALSSNAPISPKLNRLQVKSSSLTGMAFVVPLSWDERLAKSNRDYRQEATEASGGADDPVSFSITGSDFDFSARFSDFDGQPLSPTVMSSADELFYNGQIRPLQPLQDQFRSAKQMGTAESDDGSLFDFRSSANYTASAPDSPRLSLRRECSYNAVAAWEELNNRKRDERRTCGKSQNVTANQLERHPGDAGRRPPRSTDEVVERVREGRQRNPETSRDRRGPGRRITRSLSPLRVFHWDDQPARASYEGEDYFSTCSSIDGKDGSSGKQASRKKKSKAWTLKELLGRRDGKVHNKQNSRNSTDSSSSFHERIAKSFQGSSKRMDDSNCKKGKNGGGAATITPPQKQQQHEKQQHHHQQQQQQHRNGLRSPKGARSPHELHYATHRQQAEQMRKRTFLPYRQGLLGCLGFSYFPESYRPGGAPPSMKTTQRE